MVNVKQNQSTNNEDIMIQLEQNYVIREMRLIQQNTKSKRCVNYFFSAKVMECYSQVVPFNFAYFK